MISLRSFFTKYNLTDSQSKLVQKLETFISSQNSSIFLLKGYAGTGKTFITKGLTEYFREIKRNYILAAPTGKAAKVISQKTRSAAYTIHKTIYTLKNPVEYIQNLEKEDKTYKFYFSVAVNEDSNDTVYIIDEASMISDIYNEMEFIRFGSGFLLRDLMHYINLDCNDHRKKIIFIGDNAQLPPVGMSFSPALNKQYILENFGFRAEEFELTDVVRQEKDSGILKNTLPIRKSLENKVFNTINFDTSFHDTVHLDHINFMQQYIEVTKGKVDHQTMIVAYSNASVKEYNYKVRGHLFPNHKNQICAGDKIIVTSNNANHGIFISNGDFGIIEEILSPTETKIIKTKGGKIDVSISFRDVVVLFYDIDGAAWHIRCKIIENLLFSEQASLSSDENKGIYIDFMRRHPGLKPNTKEWVDTLMMDPYFNALKVKFGYAITCHKAQGSEWKNLFLNCKTMTSVLSENYFRWFYTAITRAKSKIYTLDEPHINLLSNIKNLNANEIAQSNTSSSNTLSSGFNFQSDHQRQIYIKIKEILDKNNIEILQITHHQYQEQYTIALKNE
ncbi:AAA family ATPase, partial [uncultured Campylobacter sp.]|uniref:ATP-dependent DNA helicase n=1 Tax=uncultured Campylobacter sp. TaxID=218934 RepID=UPI00260F156C